MKKLILLLVVAIVATSCTCKCDYKYEIADNHNNVYYTNSYNKLTDGCITFENKPQEDKAGETTTICGNYTITVLNQE